MRVSPQPNQFSVLKVIKAADETVNNSDVLQDDDELIVSLLANSDYIIDFALIYTSSAVADIKFRGVFAESDMQYGCVGVYANTGLSTTILIWQTNMGSTTGIDSAGGNGATVMAITGTIMVHTVTATTFKLQWAQNTAEVSNTIVKAGSVMHAMKL